MLLVGSEKVGRELLGRNFDAMLERRRRGRMGLEEVHPSHWYFINCPNHWKVINLLVLILLILKILKPV